MCRGKFPNQRVQRCIFTHLTKRKIFATPFRQQQVNFNFTFPCGSKMNWYQDDTISIFGWTYWRPKNSVMETLSKKIICIIQNLKNQPIWQKKIRLFFDSFAQCAKNPRTLLLDFAPLTARCSRDFGLHHSTSARERGALKIKRWETWRNLLNQKIEVTIRWLLFFQT